MRLLTAVSLVQVQQGELNNIPGLSCVQDIPVLSYYSFQKQVMHLLIQVAAEKSASVVCSIRTAALFVLFFRIVSGLIGIFSANDCFGQDVSFHFPIHFIHIESVFQIQCSVQGINMNIIDMRSIRRRHTAIIAA